jgi:drug resistance MFS transporter, drug:H+ antiporter-2 family
MGTNNRVLRALTLLVASLGSFMVLLDGSIVFVALPEIQKDLESHISTLQWTVDAYTLPFAALMLTVGTLGDRCGRKKIFLIGLVVFVLGSALCGFASSVEILIAGRVTQGIGAAAINTGSLSLLVSTFSDLPGRAKAIGVWTAVSGISIALGPLVGGVLINAFSWQAIFLVNLPIGVLALALGAARLLESRDPSGRGIDAVGQILVTGGLAALIIALIEGERRGWSSTLIIALFAIAAVLLVGFAFYERRSADPLLPLDLFTNRTFTAACLIASLLGFIIVGAMFFMSQYFMSIQGFSPLASGVRLLPLTLGIFFLSPPASRIAAKVGPRIPVIVGSVLVVLGFALLSTIDATSSFSSIWWKVALTGAGIGMMFAPLTVAVMGTVPPQRSGLGSSMINTTRITGITAGTAILGTVVVTFFKGALLRHLVVAGTPVAQAREIVNTIGEQGAAGATRATLGGVALDAYIDAMHVAFYVCCATALVACGLAVTLMLRGPLQAPGRPGGPVSPESSTG